MKRLKLNCNLPKTPTKIDTNSNTVRKLSREIRHANCQKGLPVCNLTLYSKCKERTKIALGDKNEEGRNRIASGHC
jgi:hypothetical protein